MNRSLNEINLQIFGASHSLYIGGVLDGIPTGIKIDLEQIDKAVFTRKGGGLGTTSRVEFDQINWLSGISDGITNGLPIAFAIENKNIKKEDYKFSETPRPGHSDFTQLMKYGQFAELSGGGQSSGRMTIVLVIAGQIARQIIPSILAKATIKEIGGEVDYLELIERTQKEGDSLGGIVECTIQNVPAGLGEPFFDSVESVMSHLLFSIPGVKGVEFGAGFASARMKGSEFYDKFVDTTGRTITNNSGGINGGITNGNDIVFRVAFRPPSSIRKPVETINIQTGEKVTMEIGGRHDVSYVLRTPVIIESVAYLVIADFYLRAKIKKL